MKIIKLLEFLEKEPDLKKFINLHPEYSNQELKSIFSKLKKIYKEYLKDLDNFYELYIDGASRGNPGKAAAGFIICKNGKEIARGGKYLGIKTNNEAEYYALLLGLQKCKELNIKKIKIFSDSKLIVNQVKGSFKVKDEKLKNIYKKVLNILKNFDYEIEHIPREKNKIADNIANYKLDEII